MSYIQSKLVKTCARVGYGCRVGGTVPRTTRNSSRVAASVRLVGNRFHSLMVLGKKFLYTVTVAAGASCSKYR